MAVSVAPRAQPSPPQPGYRYALDPEQEVHFARGPSRIEYNSMEEVLAAGHDPDAITRICTSNSMVYVWVEKSIHEFAALLNGGDRVVRARFNISGPTSITASAAHALGLRRVRLPGEGVGSMFGGGWRPAYALAEPLHVTLLSASQQPLHTATCPIVVVPDEDYAASHGYAIDPPARRIMELQLGNDFMEQWGHPMPGRHTGWAMEWHDTGITLQRSVDGARLILDRLEPRDQPLGTSTFSMDEDTWRAVDDLAASRAAVAARRAAAQEGASAAEAAERAVEASRERHAGAPWVAPSQDGGEQQQQQQQQQGDGLVPGSADWVEEWAPRPTAAAGRGRAGGRGRGRGRAGEQGAGGQQRAERQQQQQQAEAGADRVAEGLPPLPPALAACAWPAVRASHLPADSDECVICCEDLGALGPVVQPACRHTLHALCAQQWLATCVRVHAVCPSCRAPLSR